MWAFNELFNIPFFGEGHVLERWEEQMMVKRGMWKDFLQLAFLQVKKQNALKANEFRCPTCPSEFTGPNLVIGKDGLVTWE